jgi:hypothetical protein
MTLADIAGWWPQIASAVGGLGGGGLITGYLSHQRAKRKQTDDVALGMVEKLQVRITEVETYAASRIDAVEKASVQERLLCDAKLEAADHKMSVLRHELGTVESVFDGLLLAIRFAPPEKIPEIVEIAQQHRAQRSARKGEARNAAQIELSAHRVIPNLD